MTHQLSGTPLATEDRPRSRIRLRRGLGIILALLALVVVSALSVGIGSNPIPIGQVWELLWNPNGSFESVIVHEQRIPRTLLGLCVGAALGVAGALMQSLTRNRLADPGILGINAGASFAVVLSVAVFGRAEIGFYLWFGFLGAATAAVLVYLLGSAGHASATPVRLALAGIAVSMAVTSMVQGIILGDQQAFNEFRLWVAGTLEYRGYAVLWSALPFIAIGTVVAMSQAPALNALALGDETGKALGLKVQRTRWLVMVAVTLLAGAATAAAGPIGFVGLGVPYVARAVCGPDQRWVIPYTLLLAPVMLVAADVLARVVIAPQEIPVGIVAALLGGPVFIVMVRRRRIEAL